MSHSTDPIRVLFINDDSEYVENAKRFLEKYDPDKFSVLWHTDSKKSFDFLDEKYAPVDIILTDYELSGTDGLEVTRKIKELHPKLPIIFLTSNKELKIAVQAIKFGAEDYLVKEETDLDILVRTIVNTLNRAHLRQQMEKIQKRQLLAEKQTEAIKALIVTICHEFNNPLAAIRISLDVLQRYPLSDEQLKFIKQLESNVQVIEGKINEVRDLDLEQIDYLEK